MSYHIYVCPVCKRQQTGSAKDVCIHSGAPVWPEEVEVVPSSQYEELKGLVEPVLGGGRSFAGSIPFMAPETLSDQWNAKMAGPLGALKKGAA